MAELITALDLESVRSAVSATRREIDRAAERSGRSGTEVELLAAVKYLPVELIGILAEAGVSVVGENRAQDLTVKVAAWPGLTWDFIGHLQSRKVKDVLPRVRYVHSVAGDTVLEQLSRHGGPETKVLVEVNLAGEAGKSGIAPSELASYLERCPVPVIGLMTMPPQASSAEASRPWFSALRKLAERHGLPELSMGTSQDYGVAVEEGATIVRVGRSLFAGPAA